MSIGLEVAIEKVAENDDAAEYAFMVRPGRGGFVITDPSGQPGRVSVDKHSGAVTLNSPCPDDHDGSLFGRAVFVLKRHWARGEYPAVTGWAA